MSDTDDFIDIAITVSDKVPEKPNFGMPMLLGYHTAWLDRYVTEYAQAADMLDDGFEVTDDLYKRAVVLKSQNPAPPTFKVGRLSTIYTQVVNLIPAASHVVVGKIISGNVNGTAISHEVTVATAQAIVEAIETLVEAATGITSTEDDTKIVATSTAGLLLSHNWNRGMNVIDVTADGDFDDDIALIQAEDNDWYGFTVGPSSEAILTLAAAWAESNKKAFFGQSSDWDVIAAAETGDVATALQTLGYARTAGIWHRAIAGTEWAAEAFMSIILGTDPGKATPAFKLLAGITADDLRTAEMGALTDKYFTRYKRQGGQNITYEGKTPSGRFIDTTRNVDWLEAEVRANIYSVFLNNPVVPYSTLGISMIKGAVNLALKTAVEQGVLSSEPAPFCSVPLLADTTTADRAARVLRNVNFAGRLNGAIHSTIVRGSISV